MKFGKPQSTSNPQEQEATRWREESVSLRSDLAAARNRSGSDATEVDALDDVAL